MKNSLKKLISLLAVITITTSLVSCGGKNDNNKTQQTTGENVLEMSIIDLGYGTKWAEDMGEAFKQKKKAEGKDITVIVHPGKRDTLEAQLNAGAKNNTIDLFVDEYSVHMRLVDKKTSTGEPLCADLTDVYNAVIDGETLSVKDRMYESIEKAYNYCGTGKYYAFPSLNDTNGLYYNQYYFANNNIKVPKTTKQLVDVCEKIKKLNDGISPIISYDGYWNYIIQIWWAQYVGLETYNSFYKPDYDVRPSDPESEYAKQFDGRQSALSILEELVNASNGYDNKKVKSDSFTQIQSYFLRGKSAMIPNGGWMLREMENTQMQNVDPVIMKLPVNSDLTYKFNITEEELVDAISYIDGDTDVKPQIEEDVLKEIEKARGLTSSSVAYAYPCIAPSYSDALDLVKEFLVFSTTEEAMRIKIKTAGIMPFVKCDYDKVFNQDPNNSSYMNNFIKSKLNVMSADDYNILMMSLTSDPLYFANNLQTFNKDTNPANILGSSSTGIYRTVQQLLADEQEFMDTSWSMFVNAAKSYKK